VTEGQTKEHVAVAMSHLLHRTGKNQTKYLEHLCQRQQLLLLFLCTPKILKEQRYSLPVQPATANSDGNVHSSALRTHHSVAR